MKEFFKKPLVHYTTVLTIVAIICGLLIGGVNAITAPVIKQNEIDAQNKSYQEVLPAGETFEVIELDNAPASITTAVKGLDSSNQVVGYIYIASGTNKHGSMTIAISIDAQGKVLGAQFVSIQQTLNVEGTRFNLSLFVGTQISALTPDGDLVSGVTNSFNTVRALLTDVAAVHAEVADVPSDPLVTFFGEDYSLEVDSTFVPTDYVINKQNVKDSSGVEAGTIYELEGTGEYIGYDGVSSGSITMHILLDENAEIISILMPESLYGHTGSFKARNDAYLNEFIGLTISEIQAVIDANVDLKTGATGSRTLIDELLVALKEVVLG